MSAYRFKTAARTHVGHVRQRNEDSHLARPEIGLWVVADGMGGHTNGDRASQLVTSTLSDLPVPDSAKDLFRAVRDALYDCHEELVATSEEICGCTVVALLAYDESYACVWAGDSRIYRYRDGELAQLTRDHNLASDLIARGTDPDEARHSPWAHRLTRAVGIPGPLELDVDQDAIREDDVFLLCSDGVSGELKETTLLGLLAENDLEAAADAMVEATLERGAPDNLTLVMVRVKASGELDPETTIPRLRT